MQFCLIGHDFRYEIEKLIRIFLPFEKLEYFTEKQDSNFCLLTEVFDNEVSAVLNFYGKVYQCKKKVEDKNGDFKKDQWLLFGGYEGAERTVFGALCLCMLYGSYKLFS